MRLAGPSTTDLPGRQSVRWLQRRRSDRRRRPVPCDPCATQVRTLVHPGHLHTQACQKCSVAGTCVPVASITCIASLLVDNMTRRTLLFSAHKHDLSRQCFAGFEENPASRARPMVAAHHSIGRAESNKRLSGGCVFLRIRSGMGISGKAGPTRV